MVSNINAANKADDVVRRGMQLPSELLAKGKAALLGTDQGSYAFAA